MIFRRTVKEKEGLERLTIMARRPRAPVFVKIARRAMARNASFVTVRVHWRKRNKHKMNLFERSVFFLRRAWINNLCAIVVFQSKQQI